MANKSKIQIGAEVVSSKYGNGIITRIITKSTGYVEVDFCGNLRKEMAFNLTDIDGQSMKAKPSNTYATQEAADRANRRIDAHRASMRMAVLQDNFLDCQIKSGNYNIDNIAK